MSWDPEVERSTRYAAAAPVVAGGAAWADLGCGDGAAALAGLGDLPPVVVLVDGDPGALRSAARAVERRETDRMGRQVDARAVEADLGDPEGVAVAREALAELGDATITCFGALDRLRTFVPLLDLLGELAERHGATVILDVPNDAFAGRRAGQMVWGERAFDELRRLLPGEPVLARQIPLAGSAVVVGDGESELTLPAVAPSGEPPSHLIAAFGPRAHQLTSAALARPLDRREPQRRERQLAADVAYLEARLGEPAGG